MTIAEKEETDNKCFHLSVRIYTILTNFKVPKSDLVQITVSSVNYGFYNCV